MNLRSALLAAASVVVGVGLIILLVLVSGVDWHGMMRQLAAADRMAMLRLTLLMGVNTFLSSQKWRLVDGVLRDPADPVPSRATAFGVTSLGIALGQVLPVQVSVSIARTLGTWRTGRALRRGTLGTLCEQGFDFLTVCFLAIASAGTYLLHGGPVMWMAFSAATILLALFAVGSGMKLLFRLTSGFEKAREDGPKWRRVLADLRESGFLEPRLGRRLIAISSLRFLILVLMAGQTTIAIHSTLPLWHIALAMPFVVVAASVGLTPGGLGLTEFTYAGMLSLLGTPLAATSQWALANRILTFVASLGVAVFGLIVLASRTLARSKAKRLTGTAQA